jgi:hypothetical protein
VVLDAPLPAPLRLLAPAHRLATAALIPARLREAYGLRWSRARGPALVLAARSLRVLAAPLFRAAGRVSPPERAPRPRASEHHPPPPLSSLDHDGRDGSVVVRVLASRGG